MGLANIMACKFARVNQKSVDCIYNYENGTFSGVSFKCPFCSINASGDSDNYGDLLYIKFNRNGKCEDFQEGQEHYLENERIF
jgi:hypothetical protein